MFIDLSYNVVWTFGLALVGSKVTDYITEGLDPTLREKVMRPFRRGDNLTESTVRVNQAVQGIAAQNLQVQNSTNRIEGIIAQGSSATHRAVEDMGVASGLLHNSAGVLNQSAARLEEAAIPLQQLSERTSNAVERLGDITALREEIQRLHQELAASRELNRTFYAAIQKLETELAAQKSKRDI